MTAHQQVIRRLTHQYGHPENRLKGARITYHPETDTKPARLTGYGWATYAARHNGYILLFEDWAGYSSSTTGHLRQIHTQLKNTPFGTPVYIDVNNKRIRTETPHGQLGADHRRSRTNNGQAPVLKHSTPTKNKIDEWLNTLKQVEQ